MRYIGILLIFIAGLKLNLKAQVFPDNIKSYTNKNGLSGNIITSFAQTYNGLLWIGTTEGLNRFDGLKFQKYTHKKDSTSISDNYITTQFVDHKNNLWVGTKTKGLNLYVPEKDQFIRYNHKDYDQNTLTDYFITCINEDSNHNLWVGTSMGLNLFDEKNQSFKRYFHETEILIDKSCIEKLESVIPQNIINKISGLQDVVFQNVTQFTSSLHHLIGAEATDKHIGTILNYSKNQRHAEHIQCLAADKKGNLWIGYLNHGLSYFNPSSNYLENIELHKKNGEPIKNINALLFKDSILWVGDNEGNLIRYDVNKKEERLVVFSETHTSIESLNAYNSQQVWVGTDMGTFTIAADQKAPMATKQFIKTSLSYLSSKCMFKDDENNFWIGMDQHGVVMLSSGYFDNNTSHNSQYDKLEKKSISAILQDHEGNLWIGFYAGGIQILKQSNNEIATFLPGSAKGNLGKGSVYSIFQDNLHNIYVGTYDGGLQVYNPSSRSFFSSHFNSHLAATNKKIDVRDITQDESGNLWLCLHGAGVAYYKPAKDSLVLFNADYLNWQHSLSNDWTYTLTIDKSQTVWIGSVAGISNYNLDENSFTTYNEENSNLTHNQVRCVFTDSKNNTWIGTENGLNKASDTFNGSFTTYGVEEGIDMPNITAILEDKDHNLWVTTKNSIYLYNESRNHFINYQNHYDINNNEIIHQAAEVGENGKFYLGGNQGLTIIDPNKKIAKAPTIPINVNGLTYFNNYDSVKVFNPQNDYTFTIPSELNNISIDFNAITFNNPEDIIYSYKLTNLDSDWRNIGNKNNIAFSSLPPGQYTLQLKYSLYGIDSADIFNLNFTISPPFYLSATALLFYVLISALILILWLRWKLNTLKIKRQEKQKALSASEQQAKEHLRIRFLSHFSDELRAPLALINEPLEKIIADDEKLDERKRKDYLALMNRNTKRLLHILNEFNTSYNGESASNPLEITEDDIIDFCRQITEAYFYTADQNNIEFTHEFNVEQHIAFFDKDKLEKILYNLLSHSFTYAYNGGQVSFKLTIDTHNIATAKLNLSYTGTGLTKNELKDIFEKPKHSAFESLDEKIASLEIVKEIVSIHKGQFRITSKHGEGANFQITLPISEHFYSSHIFKSPDPYQNISNAPISTQETNDNSQLPLLLIADDHDDLRWYLKDDLSYNFNIREANNGYDAFKLATEIQPDIILSDVMMPKINGIELCQKLKSDPRTAHIPVIMLTAKSSDSDQLKGIEVGADDYICKPFNISLLRYKLLNLIKLKDKISAHTILNHSPALENDKTKTSFLDNLQRVINKHMHDETFGPEKLAEILHLSRSHLYKKVKKESGHSVSILIRNMRLKKAAQLLTSSDLTIAEIAYSVGFSDPGYFARCFKNLYGQSPTDYMHLG